MIEGAAILLIGVVLGAVLDRLANRFPRKQPDAIEPKAKCSCGHSISMHDAKTKWCHAENYVKGNVGWKEWKRCPCRHYDGPTPYPEYYAPELPQ